MSSEQSEVLEWRFLFELQWWDGTKFVQRFHAWDVDGRPLWEMAWPLYELQQAYKRLRKATRGKR